MANLSDLPSSPGGRQRKAGRYVSSVCFIIVAEGDNIQQVGCAPFNICVKCDLNFLHVLKPLTPAVVIWYSNKGSCPRSG